MMNENTENMYIHFFRTQENENEKIGNDLDIFFYILENIFTQTSITTTHAHNPRKNRTQTQQI